MLVVVESRLCVRCVGKGLGLGCHLFTNYVYLKRYSNTYDMNDADESCQDLGRGLGSHKTGLSPLVIVLLTVPRRCSWYGSYLMDLKQVIFTFCISVRCYMMTHPFVRSIKLFDYRIKLWQPRTVVARANVSSSDRSELLTLSDLVTLGGSGWTVLSVASYHIRACFSTDGVCCGLARPFVTT